MHQVKCCSASHQTCTGNSECSPRWEGHSFVHKVSTQNLLETWLHAEMRGIIKKCLFPLSPDLPPTIPNSAPAQPSVEMSALLHQPCKLMETAGVCPGHSRVNICISSIITHLTRIPELPSGHSPYSVVPLWECPQELDVTRSEQRTMGTPSLPVDTMLQLLIKLKTARAARLHVNSQGVWGSQEFLTPLPPVLYLCN